MRTLSRLACAPLACLALALPTRGASLLGLLAFAWPLRSAYLDARPRWSARVSALWAAGCVAGKLAELSGALRFAANQLRRRATPLMEYKGPAADRVDR